MSDANLMFLSCKNFFSAITKLEIRVLTARCDLKLQDFVQVLEFLLIEINSNFINLMIICLLNKDVQFYLTIHLKSNLLLFWKQLSKLKINHWNYIYDIMEEFLINILKYHLFSFKDLILT